VATATEAKDWAREHLRGNGLPVGDYPHSRPPQTAFPDELKDPIRAAYRALGFLRADG
jgi:hypothetical protein